MNSKHLARFFLRLPPLVTHHVLPIIGIRFGVFRSSEYKYLVLVSRINNRRVNHHVMEFSWHRPAAISVIGETVRRNPKPMPRSTLCPAANGATYWREPKKKNNTKGWNEIVPCEVSLATSNMRGARVCCARSAPLGIIGGHRSRVTRASKRRTKST